MKALILAAGYATRLYPLTKEYPKSLLKVKGKPVINYIIDSLKAIEVIDEIIVVTNTKFISKFKKWRTSLRLKKPLSLVDDLTRDNASRRGAIGDIDFTIGERNISKDLLVIGGDNLFNGNLEEFISFSGLHKRNPVIGAYDIKNRKKTRQYGVIGLDKRNKVIFFKEKPKKAKSTLVAMCLYYFPKGKLGLIKEYLNIKTNKGDASGCYIDWLRKKEQVFAFIFKGCWYDIGEHKYYNEAKEKFLT